MIGPSLVMFNATWQSTCARDTSMEAVAMLVAVMSSVSAAVAGGLGLQVWLRLAKVSGPMLPPVSAPVPG